MSVISYQLSGSRGASGAEGQRRLGAEGKINSISKIPTPYTLHPTPYTPFFTPYTPHPTPYLLATSHQPLVTHDSTSR
ncbi:hypothetical protein [Scytonema millei]|uniref:Uncharacterized protein n=1 Tax=Scytonema millei VB511283 TaxID=1245923 RepID=A0A9X5I412_9CYAN|nr:hypothetical protein [Scytonema millei]NHC34455.1 hypothetical protein [Scytonema millei VB511283]